MAFDKKVEANASLWILSLTDELTLVQIHGSSSTRSGDSHQGIKVKCTKEVRFIARDNFPTLGNQVSFQAFNELAQRFSNCGSGPTWLVMT